MIEIALAAALTIQEPTAEGDSTGEEAAVLVAVQQLFDAMRRRDAEAFAALLVPEGTSIRVNDEGPEGVQFRVRSNAQDIRSFAANTDEWVERVWDPTIKVHGPIAMFWAPYDFHVNGKFSHCGVDLFELLKVDGKWRLSNASWTVQTQGCAPSPLGPLDANEQPMGR